MDPDPYLWQTDPDLGGPKTYGFDGSGSATLVSSLFTVPFGVFFYYLEPNSEEAEEAKRVHLAALIGVGEEKGAEAPGREYGEGRHEGGRGGRAQVVKAHTL